MAQMQTFKTFEQADQLIGKRKDKKISNNTTLRIEYVMLDGIGVGVAIVRLHSTDIFALFPDGTIVLNAGGWRTVTTKDRLNQLLPGLWRIGQDKGQWYFWKNREKAFHFHDGVAIRGDETTAKPFSTKKERIDLKLRRRCQQYAKKFVGQLAAGKVPPPGPGDCMFCGMLHTDERADVGGHLISHIGENYFVPSLLMRAVKEYPVSQATNWFLSAMWSGDEEARAKEIEKADFMKEHATDSVRKSIYRYMLSHLGQAA